MSKRVPAAGRPDDPPRSALRKIALWCRRPACFFRAGGTPAPQDRLPTVAAAAIAIATLAAYSSSFHAALVFDDLPAIVENPTIRRWWPITTALSPPNNTTVAGRPLVNLSLAVNYACGGTEPWGYHLVNLAIHVSAALVLFGLVRRTPYPGFHPPSPQPSPEGRGGRLAVAFAGALWWAVHPLQTESVTYVVQRAESLCGLFYLATLYCLLRGALCRLPREAQSARGGWYAACVLACWLGMATKEVMATAPLAALLYDRLFLAGSFRQAWRDRRGLYAGLAASWLLLAYLVLGTGGRSGSAGFHHQITPMAYAATQAGALLGYLRLSVWPRPLVFDYGRQTVASLGAALPEIVVVAGLLLVSFLVLRRWPRAGFLAAAFFLVLAPSSSVVPIATQAIAEHRMYLPLGAVTVGLACALFALQSRLSLDEWAPFRGAKGDEGVRPAIAHGYLMATLAVAALLGWQTWRRNNDYRSERSIWADTAAKVPNNPRAWVNLARADFNEGETRRALEELTKAVELDPDYADARVNRGIAYQALGALDDALRDFERAISLEPGAAGHYFRRGVVYRLQGRTEEAIADYQTAVRLQPDLANAWFNLGNLYGALQQEQAAIDCYSRAIEAAPQFANAWKNRAALLGRLGRYQQAIDDCTRAIDLAPRDADLYRNRSVFYSLAGRESEARRDLQSVGELATVPQVPSLNRLPSPMRRVE
ncbi:MAG TPA: tetratricopeptide repeat protein [Pirellulales bacterium]|jgi:tetratricopeptide (TPR) repeat protein|nr:tetratricopeptide repeat protein [Pirellulales bacterium]